MAQQKDNNQQKISRTQLSKFTSYFLFKSVEQIPFSTNASDLQLRSNLRTLFFVSAIGGGVICNSIGFKLARVYPKYKKLLVPLFASFSLVVITGSYLKTMSMARKYLFKKFKMSVANNKQNKSILSQTSRKQFK